MITLLTELLPAKYRDEIVGDLAEQSLSPSETRKELLGAVIRLFPMNFYQREDDEMKHAKLIAAVAILVVGLLQAFDSGIQNAPLWIGMIVMIAIALGIAGLFTENEALRVGIAGTVLILLIAARILSPVRLPEIMIVGFPIFFILVLGPRFMALAKQKNQPKGPGMTA